MQSVLSIENLNVHYGSIHAIKGISLEVKKGQIATLIGANGAGKTTTLNAITNLVKKSGGKILFEGEDITNLSTHEIVSRGIVLVPEGRKIFPNLTVYENLMMGAYSRRDQEKIKKDLNWTLTLFPRLRERLKQLGGTLSGGEQQMLAVARGLMSKPKLLMLDEPSLGLAPLLVKEVFQIIEEIRKEGVTILLVEQNAFAALKVADYAYVLETGKVVIQDSGKDLLNNDDVRKAYLGIATK
ncbi:ABC transporter related [Pseudothermotoga lettingae TMO]|jgi:branched-chain amino acid transport system ATP-binding protein|uniref:ABC transporter related n=2 Tax=Pseudothermotoga TaxID=1643951 RepID=A8F5D5_PSELT|nr:MULTISPECIES: ABC transporter ATP-binding protein [Pseudothermotoga]KUK20174.1 MAG: ABC transporter related [Pseudothermotoga lettingae]MDI3495120.1 branched-chain amino acid transport system ATP-binding protein [Pseudothermotoga sp.]ABV33369.1 ABC transporter related [Pseudothermotoga lettingae TMO]MDK2884461.1 branched-chain amino acid transport system ATP-binding protein [Pseudothermotoga sp.]HBJ82056.1 ABC transporter ATP-binding protein [Pseudothermotoga sp.]